MPATILNFNGIPFPGVGCNCAPPDTNGAVGQTQYVQIVNEGFQVFDKATGSSLLGPNSISSIWNGFGGACQNGGAGDPVVLYDHIANRWLISQFASATGGAPITDECVAISTTADATGTRFLLITHHRITMARMDRLFGVTMVEQGVSQLVSVDLARAAELRQTA